MDHFEDQVAVVTGAASGIGLGLSEVFANNGMKVMMADVEEAPLLAEAERLQKANLNVTPCVADVSKPDQVEILAEQTIEQYGKVHLLCNNAGVGGGGSPLWQATDRDWQWTMSINMMGVVYGLRAFVPRMLSHGEPGHIVNTSSIMGLASGGGSIYSISKHAVTCLTEGLHFDLKAAKANIGVSVLCPGLIATNIIKSARNRPAELQNDPTDLDEEAVKQMMAGMELMDRHFHEEGMNPLQVGEIVLDAIRTGRFYVLTHPDGMGLVESRFGDIVSNRPPSSSVFVAAED